jgi:hypothetical protein
MKTGNAQHHRYEAKRRWRQLTAIGRIGRAIRWPPAGGVPGSHHTDGFHVMTIMTTTTTIATTIATTITPTITTTILVRSLLNFPARLCPGLRHMTMTSSSRDDGTLVRTPIVIVVVYLLEKGGHRARQVAVAVSPPPFPVCLPFVSARKRTFIIDELAPGLIPCRITAPMIRTTLLQRKWMKRSLTTAPWRRASSSRVDDSLSEAVT